MKVTGKTGVEMEALTAVSVACLTIYDMVKAVERGMRIEGIRLIEKRGGTLRPLSREGVSSGAAVGRRRAGAGARRMRSRLPPNRRRSPTAIGRVLAADLAALRTQPPADVSAMDGYAVRAADVANAPATAQSDRRGRRRPAVRRRDRAGEAARIFTGGVVPHGADTVVIQEITTRDGDVVVIEKPTAKGRNVRAQGLDFTTGDVLLPAAIA